MDSNNKTRFVTKKNKKIHDNHIEICTQDYFILKWIFFNYNRFERAKNDEFTILLENTYQVKSIKKRNKKKMFKISI